jgi:hypothetical protein
VIAIGTGSGKKTGSPSVNCRCGFSTEGLGSQLRLQHEQQVPQGCSEELEDFFDLEQQLTLAQPAELQPAALQQLGGLPFTEVGGQPDSRQHQHSGRAASSRPIRKARHRRDVGMLLYSLLHGTASQGRLL